MASDEFIAHIMITEHLTLSHSPCRQQRPTSTHPLTPGGAPRADCELTWARNTRPLPPPPLRSAILFPRPDPPQPSPLARRAGCPTGSEGAPTGGTGGAAPEPPITTPASARRESRAAGEGERGDEGEGDGREEVFFTWSQVGPFSSPPPYYPRQPSPAPPRPRPPPSRFSSMQSICQSKFPEPDLSPRTSFTFHGSSHFQSQRLGQCSRPVQAQVQTPIFITTLAHKMFPASPGTGTDSNLHCHSHTQNCRSYLTLLQSVGPE